MLRARGDLAAALAKYSESLALRRWIAERVGTPQGKRDVSTVLNNLGYVLEARGEWAGALAQYEESLEIRVQLRAEEETPVRLRDVSVSLESIGRILEVRGELAAALARYEESLEIAWGLSASDDPLPMWMDDLGRILTRCRDIEIALGNFARARNHAFARWSLAESEIDGVESPIAWEFLLSHTFPVLHCDVEIGRLDEATQWPDLIERLVEALARAFEDPEVDREEEQLDSTTLFRCAEGMVLVARFRGAKGDAGAEAAVRARAAELRALAEALKSEEDAVEEDEQDDGQAPR